MGMYLGLPEKICGSKRQIFAFIRDRLNDRVNSWSAKLLSKGGKEVLLKSVAQALPTYVMSCFLLPKDIINKLHGAIAKFWWSTKANNRGLHWIAWEKICVSFDKGGLGFRDLHNFNLALLAKQLWWLLHHPTSLLARVLKGRYYRHTSPMEVKTSNSPLYGWRSILAAQDLLREGLRKMIGSGYNTRVWIDPWIPTIPARPANDNGVYWNQDLFVSHLIDQSSKQWRVEMLEALIDPGDIPLIQSVRPSHSFRDDGYCWSHTKSGMYTVKLGYMLATQMKEESHEVVSEPSINPLNTLIWKLKAPRKIKHFLWQALSGCIATCSRLVDRHCGTDRSCLRCGDDEESINHLLFLCPPALQTWALSGIPLDPGSFPRESLYENFDYLLLRAKKMGAPENVLARFPWILWFIWKARNEKIFNGKQINPPDTVQVERRKIGG